MPMRRVCARFRYCRLWYCKCKRRITKYETGPKGTRSCVVEDGDGCMSEGAVAFHG